MNINRLQSLYFSPTRTTQQIVDAIVAGMECSNTVYDFTSPANSFEFKAEANSLAIVGVPVYGGRVASLAVQRLQNISGENTPAVAVVLYGNREYEDALLELSDILSEKGFQVIAAGAFIGEHSYSTSSKPIAEGRPDVQDIEKAKKFGKDIMDKITNMSTLPDTKLTLPGNSPYKDGVQPSPLKPDVDTEKCTLCGTCVAVCPSGAITMEDTVSADGEKCIVCCACIKNCPESALAVTAPPLMKKVDWLHENCSVRKEPNLFLE